MQEMSRASLQTILPEGFLQRHDNEQYPLTAEDRFEIESVVKRILWAEDTRDMDAMRTLLTQDFVQKHPFGDVEGPEGMVNFVLSQPEGFDGIRHQHVSILSQGTGESEARAVSYILVIKVAATERVPNTELPTFIGHGLVIDDLKREGKRWKVRQRIYEQFRINEVFLSDAAARDKAALTTKQRVGE